MEDVTGVWTEVLEAAVVVTTVENEGEVEVCVVDANVVGLQDSWLSVPCWVNVEPDAFTSEPSHITLIVPPTSLINVSLLKMPTPLPELSTFRTPELLTSRIPEL